MSSFEEESYCQFDDGESESEEATRVPESFRALRTEVMALLDSRFCPPPSASSITERTSVLSSFVAPMTEVAPPARSLPEGSSIPSALSQLHSLLERKGPWIRLLWRDVVRSCRA